MSLDNTKLKQKIMTSKFRLLTRFPFFGVLALYFKYGITDKIPTACTDGKNILFNPEFLDKLSVGEVNWIIAHEVMHVSNGHLRRRGYRNHQLFNVACDYAVHSILKQFECGDFKMPEGVLYDSQYDNLASETIYDRLLSQAQQSGGGKSGGGGISISPDELGDHLKDKLLDSHDDWENGQGQSGSGNQNQNNSQPDMIDGGGDGTDEEASSKEWEQRMVNAASVQAGKQAGKLPAFLKELLDKLKPPKKDWRQLLQEFVTPEIFDYSFCPPDKRLSSITDCFLPDLNDTEDTVKNIVFFVDISGSMSEDDICDVYSEVVGAVSQYSSMSGYLGYFDTEVHNFSKFEDIADVLRNKPRSGGGTEFQACFDYLHDTEQLDFDDIAGIIILTDGYCGYGRSQELAGNVPVMWCFTENSIPPAPFGNSIYLKDSVDYN